MSSSVASPPDWDLEQLEVIIESPAAWQLIEAGPGTGKSAVACQRLAHLVDGGVPPSRMLLVSFTRTAVAELRDRIVSYAVAGDRARSVRISTIDSHAWSLRAGFDAEPRPKILLDGSYDLSIERTVELFRKRDPDLVDFMSRLEHLIIDEAQDMMGIRADLIVEMLRCLSESCGVTILADPAQAIYGFTTDDRTDDKGSESLLKRLETESPRPLLRRTLNQNHRIRNTELSDLFLRTRRETELLGGAAGYVGRVQKIIRETCGKDMGVATHESIAALLPDIADNSTLVLFRRRADVLMASSYASHANVQHRLRMSDTPVVVRPWLGWLFGEVTQSIIGREDFDKLWETRAAFVSMPLEGEHRDEAWQQLHRLAAAHRPRSIDLVQLRGLVARARPPTELCNPDLGTVGPILGTIHASKGREADTVVLVMTPPNDQDEDDLDDANEASIFEEGRVYYVGATRARKMLVVATNPSIRVRNLDSGRVYRTLSAKEAQLEIGREGDVDPIAHLTWSNGLDVQRAVALCVGRTAKVKAWSVAAQNYALLLRHDDKVMSNTCDLGQMGDSFREDLRQLWGRIDVRNSLKPPTYIQHLYVVCVTTVGLTEQQRGLVRPPFNQSGLALAPVVKGFSKIPFFSRRSTGQF